ncbi:glycan metabolism protein [Arachidicoccus ginsenosidimutans]|uniref:RagB/SusD family nutrient uptake outer membrane protein n=1 Tax=Arachidicoccus sp. BS20 TaxID=1850526 RepID=UPI0007F17446|nr:RagB/SusD family nutrient uptake outer membrane protein [Arachidicoccus sp. BS20]ANI88028.1 glycan metabolism protein [Arachidicoccus sp. BS20]
MNNKKFLNYHIYLFAIVVLVAATGCEKYVNIKTQGINVPGEYSNYRDLLNNTSTFERVGAAISDYASDDIQFKDSSSEVNTMLSSDYYAWSINSYRWLDVIYSPTSAYYYQDDNWNNMYNVITNANIVLTELPSVTDSSESAKNELLAEALVHRADAYFNLVQTYSKPYNASTASTDLGVPLILKETTTQSLKRASVEQTYSQIITDLKTALPNLPTTQQFTTLPSKASAYGELARVYLYMADYTNANAYADSALALNSSLNDLSTVSGAISSANYPVRKNDPEILLSKVVIQGIAYSSTAMRLSDTLLKELGTKDLRYQLFTKDGTTVIYDATDTASRYFTKDMSLGEARNIGPSVPEMMLIKAEYYARNNLPADAMTWVNKLRVKRFKAADYVALTASGADDALKIVIQERDREFFCRNIRWWDMRRLKDDSRFAETLTRVINGQTYTLAPTSNRYVFPIAAWNLQLNPEIEPNP